MPWAPYHDPNAKYWWDENGRRHEIKRSGGYVLEQEGQEQGEQEEETDEQVVVHEVDASEEKDGEGAMDSNEEGERVGDCLETKGTREIISPISSLRYQFPIALITSFSAADRCRISLHQTWIIFKVYW